MVCHWENQSRLRGCVLGPSRNKITNLQEVSLGHLYVPIGMQGRFKMRLSACTSMLIQLRYHLILIKAYYLLVARVGNLSDLYCLWTLLHRTVLGPEMCATCTRMFLCGH